MEIVMDGSFLILRLRPNPISIRSTMPVPLVSVKEMREWEARSWESGIRETEVIDNVGRKTAAWIMENIATGSRILMLVGKGNNGADVRAASEYLDENSFQILVKDALNPDDLLKQLQPLASSPPDLVVDGLFGIGLNKPLDGVWKSIVSTVNEWEVPILSLDCPSGLNAEDGTVGTTAIRATWTLTIGAVKLGMLTPEAASWTGRILLAHEVGLHPDGPKSHTQVNWILNSDIPSPVMNRQRLTHGHKGSFGHLLSLVGSPGYQGAAILSARAAQIAQPGLISVMTIGDAWFPVASNLLSPMVHRFTPDTLNELLMKATAILIGPGLATSEARNHIYPLIQEIWKTADVPVVVDASALDWIPSGEVESDQIRVITPHPGEAARMLHRTGDTASTPNADRTGTARRLSQSFGDCAVILKGHQTVIYSPEFEEFFINPTGNAHLAQGGAGDVLAGLTAGYLAHRSNSANHQSALQAIVNAVWLHGAAADSLQFENMSWTIEDLVDQLKYPAAQQFMVSPD